MVDPPKPPPTPPKLPRSLLRASFIGKPFTGKSTSLQRLEAEFNVEVLSVEGVLSKAVETFFAEKKKYERQESRSVDNPEDAPVIINGQDDEKDKDQLHVPTITVEPSSSVCMNTSLSEVSAPSQPTGEQTQPAELDDSLSPQPNHVPEEVLQRLSSMAQLGHKAHITMATGESLDDETAIEIFVEVIKQLPERNCWILDNFPTNQEQAKV